MMHFPEYGGDGELPLAAYGLTEDDVAEMQGDMPDAIAELHDAAAEADMETEIEAAWAKRHKELVALGLEVPELAA